MLAEGIRIIILSYHSGKVCMRNQLYINMYDDNIYIYYHDNIYIYIYYVPQRNKAAIGDLITILGDIVEVR